MQRNKPIYKVMDGKGRVLIPFDVRTACDMGSGDIVRLELGDGTLSVRRAHIFEIGDNSPEALQALVIASMRLLPPQKRLEVAPELLPLLINAEH